MFGGVRRSILRSESGAKFSRGLVVRALGWGIIAGNRSINWINSLMIHGPDDGKVSMERTRVAGMKAHITVPVSHPFLMKRRPVIDLTIQFLKHGSFTPRGGIRHLKDFT